MNGSDGLFVLLLSRQALPLRRHIYLVVSQREWGFISSVMNGKVNQVLAQQRGFVDL